MFVYQNGKLYSQRGAILVGVEIHPDKFIEVEGSEYELAESYRLLTFDEARRKFNVDPSLVLPVEEVKVEEVVPEEVVEEIKVEEVVKPLPKERKNVTTSKAKSVVGKRGR